MSRIAHKGIKGSFTYLSAMKYFGMNHDFIGLPNFSDIFESVWRGYADYGVVPIENSLVGSIYEIYDELCKKPLFIVAESYMRIEHFLIGRGPLDKVRKVFSHPKAFEQCSELFKKHPWFERGVSDDTAGAADYVSRSGDRSLAAISSAEASQIYGLSVLLPNVEDNKANYTRFVVIAKQQKPIDETVNKCSLTLKLKHVPGALSKVLKTCYDENVNLSKIESRPIVGKPFEYQFYLDLTAENLPKILDALLNNIRSDSIDLNILGMYKMGEKP